METLIAEMLKIMPLGQVLGLLLLVYLLRMVRELRDQFREMNGSVRELKVWTAQHDKQDTERFEDNRQEHRAIWAKFENHRK